MEEINEYFFDHEKLNVYRKSLEFIVWVQSITKESKNNTADHLERAAESIVLNISEGNGKFTAKDKCRFF